MILLLLETILGFVAIILIICNKEWESYLFLSLSAMCLLINMILLG
jgi:hypothetical protein